MSSNDTEAATQFDPDPEVTAERQPAACPFCGHDGAFDGQGSWTDEIVRVRAGVETTYEGTYDRHRCPDCNGRFTMLSDAEKTDSKVKA